MSEPTLFDSRLKLEFLKFHQDNPHVYELFKRFAWQAIIADRGHFGAKMIWERMRWYARFETTDQEYKLNNNYHAYYSRLFMEEHPEHEGFFRTRRLKSG